MLKFNLLLPEERKYKRKKKVSWLSGVFVLLLAVVFCGCYFCCLWQQAYYSQLHNQQKSELKSQREQLLQLESDIKGETENAAELASLQQISTDLYQWKEMLADITEATSDLLWLTQMKTAAELEWSNQADLTPVNSNDSNDNNDGSAVNTEVPGETVSGEKSAVNAEINGTTASGGKKSAGSGASAVKATEETTDESALIYNSLLQRINRFLEIEETNSSTGLTTAPTELRAQYLLLQGQAQEANSIARYYTQLRQMSWFSEVRLVDGLLNEEVAGTNSGLIEFRIWARLKNDHAN